MELNKLAEQGSGDVHVTRRELAAVGSGSSEWQEREIHDVVFEYLDGTNGQTPPVGSSVLGFAATQFTDGSNTDTFTVTGHFLIYCRFFYWDDDNDEQQEAITAKVFRFSLPAQYRFTSDTMGQFAEVLIRDLESGSVALVGTVDINSGYLYLTLSEAQTITYRGMLQFTVRTVTPRTNPFGVWKYAVA